MRYKTLLRHLLNTTRSSPDYLTNNNFDICVRSVRCARVKWKAFLGKQFIFVVGKKRPTEAIFSAYKNVGGIKNLECKTGLASNSTHTVRSIETKAQ